MAVGIALKTPVAEGGPSRFERNGTGEPPGLVPGGAGGLRAISIAKQTSVKSPISGEEPNKKGAPEPFPGAP